MPVNFSDLQLAFEFVSSGGMGENEAYLDRQSGKNSATTKRNCPTISTTRNTFQFRIKESSTSASLWPWISLVSSCPTTMTKFATSSAEEVLTADIRSCWCAGTPSNGGTISRTNPRRRLCGSGARRTGSTSAGPEVTLLLSTGGLDERNPSKSLLRPALIRLAKAGLAQYDENCGTTRFYGAGGEDVATSSLLSNRWSAAMPQPNDLSRSLVALDHNSTIIAVVELSQSSWLVGGVLPGIERQPRKKLEPS